MRRGSKKSSRSRIRKKVIGSAVRSQMRSRGNVGVASQEETRRLSVLEGLLQNLGEGLVTFDRQGRVTSWNKGAEEVYGYKANEVLGKTLEMTIPKGGLQEWKDRMKKVMVDGKIVRNHPLERIRKGGKHIWVMTTSSPIKVQNGQIIGATSIIRDFTERRILEGKVRESEEKYRSLVEHSPDGVAVTHQGKFLFANLVFASIYGFKNEHQLLDRSVSEVVTEEQREDVLHWFIRAETAESILSRYEYKGLRKDKKEIDVEVRVTQFPFEGQTCLLSFHRNITERKQLHEELGEAERIVGDILATMGDALVITDLNGKVLQVNREFETMTGFRRSEAFGIEFPYPWLMDEEMARFVLWISELREKNYLHDFDMNWLSKDKRKLAVSLNTTLLRNSRGEPIAMLNIGRDISERKRLSEELEARSRQIETLYQETLSKSLEIQRRNKELDDFTYVVSHDLKEPLVTIEGYGKILENDFQKELGSTGLDYLNSVITAANRMKKFIDDLLALTRLSRITESFQPTPIGKLLDEIRSDLEFTLRERSVRLIIENTMPVIRCSYSQMKLVFQNLISNAIKFNDKPAPEIVIGYHDDPKEYRFFVKDNGIGIEEQYFEKIFGIFQRLHRSEEYSGTGVGLTIVKKIIDIHQGKIWVESKVGKGTTFHITIPKSAP